MVELYRAAGVYNVVLYLLIALLDPYNAFSAVQKYTVHSALSGNFIVLIFPKSPAQTQTVS